MGTAGKQQYDKALRTHHLKVSVADRGCGLLKPGTEDEEKQIAKANKKSVEANSRLFAAYQKRVADNKAARQQLVEKRRPEALTAQP